MPLQAQTRQNWSQNGKLRFGDPSHVPVSSHTADTACTLVEGCELWNQRPWLLLLLFLWMSQKGSVLETQISVPTTPAQSQRIPGAPQVMGFWGRGQASMAATPLLQCGKARKKEWATGTVVSKTLGAERALPIFMVFVFLKKKKVFSAHTSAQLSTMINDGPFFKFPLCSAWGLASVDMHWTRINGFGKPTRLSTWQQMVQLKAFVVLTLELAATWSSYHFINNDAATAVWINCPLYFAGPTMGADSFMMVRRDPQSLSYSGSQRGKCHGMERVRMETVSGVQS